MLALIRRLYMSAPPHSLRLRFSAPPTLPPVRPVPRLTIALLSPATSTICISLCRLLRICGCNLVTRAVVRFLCDLLTYDANETNSDIHVCVFYPDQGHGEVRMDPRYLSRMRGYTFPHVPACRREPRRLQVRILGCRPLDRHCHISLALGY